MKKINELLKAYVIDIVRRPVNLLFAIIMVLGILFLTAFVLNTGAKAEIIASYSVFIASYTSLVILSQGVPTDKEKGLYRMYRSSRLSKFEYISSKVLTTSLSLFISLLVAVVGYFAADVYLSIWILLVLLLSSLAHAGIGLVVASYVENSSEAQRLIQVLFFAMLFLAPVFYTPEGLPEIIQIVQKIVPLTYGVEAMRALMVDGKGIEAVWQNLLIPTGLTVASLVAGYRKLEF